MEILDLGRNQLSVLPSDIAKLTSLKVLSIRKNQIRELPICLAEMGSLQVIKFEGNPLVFPPKEVLQAQAPSPPNDGFGRDTDVTEVAITLHIKRFMKQYTQHGGRSEGENTSDDMSETGSEAPRPLKRVVSGRFPVKVNGTEVNDMRSPVVGRPPPLPSRAHYRGLSQQSTTMRRPGVMPLTLGNANERVRSNSETIVRERERSESRNRRMGMLAKKGSDLGTLDETKANNRFSHYRGLSHESAMQGAPTRPKDPSTPVDSYPQRPLYVRRLSVLPERRRESRFYDPVVEAAKGLLYSVFQIHPMIQMLMGLTNENSAKRSSLEIVFYNTNMHVEELEQEIQKHETAIARDDEHSQRENENVHRACQTLVSAYGHVCTLLADNIDTFVDNGDPRYIRTLLMLLYNSVMELRVTISSAFGEQAQQRAPNSGMLDTGNTLRPHIRLPSAASLTQRPYPPRGRPGTAVHNPGNLRVATDVSGPPGPHGHNLRRVHPQGSATPRSGESFTSINSRDVGSDMSEEDAQFDKIFLALQKSTDVVLQTLPRFNGQLTNGFNRALQGGAPNDGIQKWKRLIGMVNNTIQQTEILKSRLSLIKLKEPGLRSQVGFWNLCSNFESSWTATASIIKASFSMLPLPNDTKYRLRPIHQAMKTTRSLIMQSPWHHLYESMDGNGHAAYPGDGPPMSPTQVPITPQTAALGPAMQATMPKTPQNPSLSAAFHGNVFDRADALMANPGVSMSRPGFPRKGNHSGFNSLSSVNQFTPY